MSFSEIHLIDKITRGFLGLTLFLVVTLGTLIFTAAKQPEPFVVRSKRETQSRIVQVRDPASQMPLKGETVVHSVVNPMNNESKVETYDLGCLKKTPYKLEIVSAAKQVRIKGHFCRGQTPLLDGSSVVNKTNGYDGSLFGLKKSEFTTDYLTLTEGRNHIFLDIATDSGQRAITEIVISRR